jgi:hypothetical protein
MRLVIRLLSRDLIDITIERDHQAEPEVEHGVPFGFSGGAGLITEHAEEW